MLQFKTKGWPFGSNKPFLNGIAAGFVIGNFVAIFAYLIFLLA
jgi:hypothetical protein